MEPPVANFNSVCNTVGPGSCIPFSNRSTNAGQGAAWEWTFPGGTPLSSNQEKPYVCYETEGNSEVSLTVKNGVGEDSYTWTQYVQVVKGDKLPFSENFELGVLPES